MILGGIYTYFSILFRQQETDQSPLLEMVDLLLYWDRRDDSEVMRSKISLTKEFMMDMVLDEIPGDGGIYKVFMMDMALDEIPGDGCIYTSFSILFR